MSYVPARVRRTPGRRRTAIIGAATALTVGLLSLGSLPANADESIAASADTALTGSAVPVTVNVLANDTLPAAVASVTVGTVVGGDATNVTVGDDFSITFANNNADYPNSSSARQFKTADFTVPYTVTDVDGNSSNSQLTVTVAGKPVSPTIHSWIVNDPSTGSVVVNNLRKLDLYPYPQTAVSNRAYIPGYGVTVTGVVSAEHASAVPVAGGIELRANPSNYNGNDVVTLQLTDAWGRTVNHTTGVTWVNRAAIYRLHTKVGVGQTATIDLQKIVDDAGFSAFAGSGFSTLRAARNGTFTEGDTPQQIKFTPAPGFVGVANQQTGPEFAWAYRLTNPWLPAGHTGPVGSAMTNYMYIDVQAPPQAADVVAATNAGQPVDLNVRAPATLPWAASTLDLRDAPEHGTVVVTGDGQVRYQPDSDFPMSGELSAQDSFTFAWVDDVGQESVARATVTVRAVPTLADHAVVTPAGVPVDIDLLADSFGDRVAATAVGQGSFGAAQLAGPTATYTPEAGFVGDDSFSYSGTDAYGQVAQGTVRVRVMAEPAIADQHHSTPRNTSITVDPIVVAQTGNALIYSPELTLDDVGDPAHGTVVVENGSVVYRPDLGYVGMDQATVRVKDAWGRTAEAVLNFDVYAEDLPVIDPVPTPPTPAPTEPVPTPVPTPAMPAPALPTPEVPTPADPIPTLASPKPKPAPKPVADAQPTSRHGGGAKLASTGLTAGPILGLASLLIVGGGAVLLTRRRKNNA